MPTDTTLSALFPSSPSLHPTLSLVLTQHHDHHNTSDADQTVHHDECHLHTFLSLPDELFVDPYELDDRWGPMEKPWKWRVDDVLRRGGGGDRGWRIRRARARPDGYSQGLDTPLSFSDGNDGGTPPDDQYGQPLIWYLSPPLPDLERPVLTSYTPPTSHPTSLLHLVLPPPPPTPPPRRATDAVTQLSIPIPLHARYLAPSPLSPLSSVSGAQDLRIGSENGDGDVGVFGWWVCPGPGLDHDPPSLHPLTYAPPSTYDGSTLTLPTGLEVHRPIVQVGTVMVVWAVWWWVLKEMMTLLARKERRRRKARVNRLGGGGGNGQLIDYCDVDGKDVR